MKVEFTSGQYEFLKANLTSDNHKLFLVVETNKIYPFIFELDDLTIDDIRDWAMEKQVFLGFDSDYNLNQDGIMLERIIDLLYM